MTKKLKVLIGDDTKDFGAACAEVLRTMGFFCISRQKDGLVLFDAIKDESPDVAIVDLSMSGIDAIELIKKINRSNFKKPVFMRV